MGVVAEDRFGLGPVSDPHRYVVDHPSGLGSEGVVYRCRRGGVIRAVKVCPMRTKIGRERERLDILDSLVGRRHRGLVGVHEHFFGGPIHSVGSDAGPPSVEYLVMDWVEGQTLADARPRIDVVGASDASELAALVPVAEALDCLRSGALTDGRSVAHGDVKPDNIMIRADGSAVLVDLGLLHGIDERPHLSGTEGYRMPRAASSGGDDLYGLAGVVHYVITSEHPSDDPTVMADRLRGAGCPARVQRLIGGARAGRHRGGAADWLSEVVAAMRSTRTYRRPLAKSMAALALLGGLALTTRLALDRSTEGCDPVGWAEDAARVQSTLDRPLAWRDVDGDCLHDAYEINAIGSDPADPDGSVAWLTSADDQLRYLVAVHQLLHSEVWLDPAVCRPDRWTMAAVEWRRSRPGALPWADPDEDCLATVHEHVVGTDPHRADSDSDGVIDSIDPDSSNGLIDPLDVQLSPEGPVAAQPSGRPPRLDRPRSADSGD